MKSRNTAYCQNTQYCHDHQIHRHLRQSPNFGRRQSSQAPKFQSAGDHCARDTENPLSRTERCTLRTERTELMEMMCKMISPSLLFWLLFCLIPDKVLTAVGNSADITYHARLMITYLVLSSLDSHAKAIFITKRGDLHIWP